MVRFWFPLLICLSTLPAANAAGLKGEIRIDGSSTVFPVTEAVAEDFGTKEHSVRVTVGASGTGGGFKKFAAGETDISDASRPIKPSEISDAQKKSIQFMELPIATDGLTIVVHPSNTFVKSFSKEQLKKIWDPSSTVKLWSDVDPSFPKEKIALFGPGPDNGTFDYFTEEVVGKPRASRSDYTASSDYNVLVKGISASKFALGYFGHAYYMSNKTKVRAVPIETSKGPIEPTDQSVASGIYPLSRTLLIYVNVASAKRPEVDSFVKYYLDSVKSISQQVGYLPLTDAKYSESRARYTKAIVGSQFQKPVPKS